MSSDPASLDHLHDLVVPPPEPLWPPAPGWIVLLGVVTLLLLVVVIRSVLRAQRNRYRREALAEVGRVRHTEDDARFLAGLGEVLKRCAVTAFPRLEVASLHGAPWFEFLDRTGGTRFANGLGERMEDAAYRSSAALDPKARHEALAQTRRWIRHHRGAA